MSQISAKYVVERLYRKPLEIPASYFSFTTESIEPHTFRSCTKYKAELSTNLTFTVDDSSSHQVASEEAQKKIMREFWSVFYCEIEDYLKVLMQEVSSDGRSEDIKYIAEIIAKSVSFDHFLKRLSIY